MKLSEAMMLGDSLRIRDSAMFLRDGGCGCAIGGALLATGCTFDFYKQFKSGKPKYIAPLMRLWWPWVTDDLVWDISGQFNEVCMGRLTFEKLVDYVASIEPSCGDCNRFDCTCKPAAVPVEEMKFANK